MTLPQQKRAKGMPALELIEEATALLKSAPMALLTYYLATVPFVLGLLFYWAEMSGSATASDLVAVGALGLAVLFVVMKTGQARFACAMREQLAPGLDDAWTPRRWARCALTQGIWQPWGIIVLPCSALLTLPLPYVYAFYQNLLLTGSGSQRWNDAGKKAWKLATFWPKQSMVALTILLLFGLIVYLNGWILMIMIPGLVKTLLGFDSVFTRFGYSFFNSTFLSATVCFAYLALDPLFKSVYVLRCFYAESRNSGADLQADLKKVFSQTALAAWIFLILLGTPSKADAQEALPDSSPHPAVAVPPSNLDETIKDVLNRREYRWRLPPIETKEEVSKGFFSKFIEDLVDGTRSVLRNLAKWVDDVWKSIEEFLDKLFKRDAGSPTKSAGGTEWFSSAKTLALVLLIAVCAVVAVIVFRYFRRRQVNRVSAREYSGVVKLPNLEDEHLLASELPEDEWLKLGDEMARRGEKRLALRAYYLAVIARLSSREFLTVAPYKTNRDYAKELRRRARGREELIAAFGSVMSIFERIWYGEHPIDEDSWNSFDTNRRIIFIPAEEPAHV